MLIFRGIEGAECDDNQLEDEKCKPTMREKCQNGTGQKTG
jgi:hypothetical protein